MTRRRLRSHERKTAIVKATLPLFARQGFAETTTKSLAKAAGISEPLLYKHFPSKEALYLEIQEHCRQGPTPIGLKLIELNPSTETLIRLVYYLMRALVVGLPAGAISWDVRHRLMVQSFLGDGVFARLLYQTRFAEFCTRIEASLKAARARGDVVASPVRGRNSARFAHHIGAWLALVQLPRRSAIDYGVSSQKLLDQTVWFVLRGMGMTDRVLAKQYRPRQLAAEFAAQEREEARGTAASKSKL